MKSRLKKILEPLRHFAIKRRIKSKHNLLIEGGIDIMNKDSSIEYVVSADKNLARFGDGELSLLLMKSNPGFQQVDVHLSDKLREVLESKEENFIIGIPYSLINLDQNTFKSSLFWMKYYKGNGRQLLQVLSPNRQYVDASLTRPYAPVLNSKLALRQISTMKMLWENKEILFVEGEYSRIGIGNNLFDNAKSIQRVICPSKDAFSKFKLIFEFVKNNGKGKLVLCSLGPTATILAYELAKVNISCIDIGHLDLEYMWAKIDKGIVNIDGRLINEIKMDNDLELSGKNKEKYEASIIQKIL